MAKGDRYMMTQAGKDARMSGDSGYDEILLSLPNKEGQGLTMYADTDHVMELARTVMKLARHKDTFIKVMFLDSTSSATLKVVPGSQEDARLVHGLTNAMGGWDIG